MADNSDWTVNPPTTLATSSKKKKGKGKKRQITVNNEIVPTSPQNGAAIVPKVKKSPKAAEECPIEKRNNAREFFSKMYTSGERLSEDRLESRPQYAANDGVWNAQSDLWLREAQLASQGKFQQQVAKAYHEFDKTYGTESFAPSGSLKEPLDPFNVRCRNFPFKKNPQTGVLEFQSDEEIDLINHGQEAEEYYAKSIQESNINNKVKQFNQQALSEQNNKNGNKKNSNGKKQYPSWYLNCKGDIDDDINDDIDDEDGNENNNNNDDDDFENSDMKKGNKEEEEVLSPTSTSPKKKKSKKKKKKSNKKTSDSDLLMKDGGEDDELAATMREMDKLKILQHKKIHHDNDNDDDEEEVNNEEDNEQKMKLKNQNLKEERNKLRSEAEKNKERNRTEKLARMARHTPWDAVALRLSELHDLNVTPRDCCRRFVLTYTTFEKQDMQSKQKQLNMQLKRGPPSSKGRGDAVLAIACLSGRSVSTTEVIINMGADVDNRSNSDGATPFLRACEGGNPHIAKLLLDKGADRYAETRDGRNGVHIAAQFKWPDLVEVLLDEGAPKCTIPRCARCKLVGRLIEKKRSERLKLKLANGGKTGVRTPEERKAAIDAAMAAFEQEFGTFEDEVEADDSYF